MNQDIRYYFSKKNRIDQLRDIVNTYDVISFDVFDTVIFRKLMDPLDVFELMSIDMGFPDFKRIRKKAEAEMREENERKTENREVSLDEIYDVLEKKYGIEKSWKNKEIELERKMTIANPDMLNIYKELCNAGKIIVFMTDMYLPIIAIKAILEDNGYTKYDTILLSNYERARKGDGSLQRKLKQLYSEKKIIHIGDNYEADVIMSERSGIDAYYYPREELSVDIESKDVLFGSYCYSVIRNSLYNEEWKKSIYYEHGFRVAGVLTAGYIKFIDEVAKQKKVEKILFCARDCDVLYKTFGMFFPKYDIEYIEISRHAIMCAANDRYFDDLIVRKILKYVSLHGNRKTIGDILIESGFDYLVPYLEEDDIERFMFASVVGNKVIEEFFYRHKEVIQANLREDMQEAKEYFCKKVNGAKRILVVDVGWSGTCITALKYFLQKTFSEEDLEVYGTLMCTSKSYALKNSIEDGTISAYVYSPYHNTEYLKYMMPDQKSVREGDLLHMPLEYMFTSISPSLVRYTGNEKGGFTYSNIDFCNMDEIVEMQKGIMDFCIKLKEYMGKWFYRIKGSAVVAIEPFLECLKQKEYCYEVYKNFAYDDAVAPFSDVKDTITYGDLFIEQTGYVKCVPPTDRSDNGKKVLFVTPELPYTGAPRSMLRMCMVAQKLGYQVVVWSMCDGPFRSEYENRNIEVRIVPEKKLPDVEAEIEKYDMAVCNTIVTDKYAKICEKHIPTIWFIREATNIPDFCRNNEERFEYLKKCNNIYCVSEYAENAIKCFTDNNVSIIHNCVEDEVDMATSYEVGTSDKVRFVQFGTMEYRKGYDVLAAAYLEMPKKYRDCSELYFAGGFINSGMPFCAYLFSKIEKYKSIHYLGVVKGERDKIETLSRMDVVVVASRDESCSLVALEGAMLSKPLIVTENVGAKYMVNEKNGCIVKTGDVNALKEAMMKLIDKKSMLKEMGKESRERYNKFASMSNHIMELKTLYNLTEKRKDYRYRESAFQSRKGEESFHLCSTHNEKIPVVVSMYVTYEQMEYVHSCVLSLLNQTYAVGKILLCIDENDFLNRDYPESLQHILEACSAVKIVRTSNKKGIINRYLCALEYNSEQPIIIVNADVEYDNGFVEGLMNGYRKHPDCVSCTRAELMMFRKDGKLRRYERWIHNYRVLQDIPSYQLMPVGFGGVMYPPNTLSAQKFDLYDDEMLTDDFALKLYAVYCDLPTVLISSNVKNKEILGTEKIVSARRKMMLRSYDDYIGYVINKLNDNGIDTGSILQKIRKDRFAEFKDSENV